MDYIDLIEQIKVIVTDLGLKPLFAPLLSWAYYAGLHYWLAPYIILLIIERVIGRRERASRKDVTFNIVYLLIFTTILAFMQPELKSSVSWIASALGGPYIDLRFGANEEVLPNIAALIIYLFVFDCFYYWWHRFQHKTSIGWLTHKLHHVDENMGVTTTKKGHPLDPVGRTIAVFLPMAIVFNLEPINIAWIAFASGLQQMFVHMNINCHLGWLNYVITLPNQHRIHHSVLLEHRDKNFAAFFPIMDVLFGTFVYPDKEAPHKGAPPTGIPTGEKLQTLWQAFTYPFYDVWQMWKKRTRLKSTI
ncbi:MAG: hypothetical protein AMJ56_06490 [Anaerolineae bacterium SG8_19]|nr:MAG: hypothetical protein AMJ56_06490 [Anaerolineae bacterium SG8_19]